MNRIAPAACFLLLLCLVSCISTQPDLPTSPAQGKHCFEKREGKEITQVSLTISGRDVTGTMSWQPFEKDGSRGTLKGTIDGDLIRAVYDYTIEGSRQTEQKQFRLTKDALLVGEGELLDPHNDGNLIIKDPSSLKFNESLPKVPCPQ